MVKHNGPIDSNHATPKRLFAERITTINVTATLVFALALFAAETPCLAQNARPNIVLILADDLGFSDLGCYGSEITTPNIDLLAREGLRFTQFYNAGRCCPTRASLLTGLYPHSTGVGHGMEDYRYPGYRGNLNDECATVAELLGSAGYETYMCGKWHLTRHTDKGGPMHNWPRQRGFDRFFGTIHGAGNYFDPVTLCRDNEFMSASGDFFYTEAIAQHATRFLEHAEKSERPFFLYLAYSAPHWPLHARESDIQACRGKYSKGWDEVRKQRHQRMIDWGVVEERWPLTPRDRRVLAWDEAPYQPWHERRMEVYAAQVEAMDRSIGVVLDQVHQSGDYSNTLVMFLSDNGGCSEEILPDWQGLHIPEKTAAGIQVFPGNNPKVLPGTERTFQSYGVPWANVSNTPFRFYKGSAHEGGIATPLVVRWPDVIPDTGGLVREPGHVVDIMATCLEAAEIGYPTIFNGYRLTPSESQSLIPLFQGQTRERAPIFWEHEGNKAVRDGKWKLVARYPGAWELYDMQADRTEMTDLAQRFPDVVQNMSQLYEGWANRSNVKEWKR